MNMIDMELRFVERTHPTHASNPLGPQTVTRILQYRVKRGTTWSDYDWSEWQDVPLGKESQ